MSEITFFSEEIDFQFNSSNTIKEWIEHTVEQENQTIETINYIFCSDEYLHKINVEYLSHDYYTDIITFDNSEEEGLIEGDIFISVERVEENARHNSVLFIEELKRVIIHGVLHLIGYNDKTDSEQEVMTQKENAYLSLPQFSIS